MYIITPALNPKAAAKNLVLVLLDITPIIPPIPVEIPAIVVSPNAIQKRSSIDMPLLINIYYIIYGFISRIYN